MTQQDFFTWAERRDAEEQDPSEGELEPSDPKEDSRESPREGATATPPSGRASRGRLFLAELPPDLGHNLREIQSMHQALEERLGKVDLVLTDNRRRMVSLKKKRGAYRLRLHHMFIGCEPVVIEALSDLAMGGPAAGPARDLLRAYIAKNREVISSEIDPEALEAQGEHHDLQRLLDKWRDILDPEGLAEVVITWGRYGKGQRTIRFGSYDFDRKLIRLHPALDQAWVPELFVEFIVYHELLHAVFPPRDGANRRMVHTPEFRQMEERFPGFEQVMAWEARNLGRFLDR